MKESDFEDRLFLKYLKLLGIKRREPGFDYLGEIIRAQVSKIPFENISKLLFKKRLNLKRLIDFEFYLNGIEEYNFGGTCYSNNYYLNRLLKWLAFDVKLCGADMENPDVHLVNIVSIENREFLVDTGYAAPFTGPIPLGLKNDFSVYHGNDRYILKPQNNNMRPKIELLRNGEFINGYTVNPGARNISEFREVIENSFNENSSFMNSLLVTRFDSEYFIRIQNMKFIESKGLVSKIHYLDTLDQLASLVENRFGISKETVLESIGGLQLIKGR